jgi:type II secretory pathway component GspD/PulD (secretin)
MRNEPAMAQQPKGQDPAPQNAAAKVATADLPKAVAVALYGNATLLEWLGSLAKDADLPFVAAVEPTDKVIEAKFAGASPRHLLASGARAAGAHLEQYGAVLTVVPGAGPEEKVLDLKHEAMPIADVLANVAKMAGANFVIDAKVTGSVAVDVERVFWRDLVDALAAAVGAEVDGGGIVLRIVPKGQMPAPRVFFAYDRSPVAKVVETIGKISGERVVVDPAAAGTVTVRVKNQPATDVLAAVAATQGCVLAKEGGVWQLRPKDAKAPAKPK